MCLSMVLTQSKFEVLEAEVKEINGNKDTLKRNLLDLIEVQHILYQAQGFFQEASSSKKLWLWFVSTRHLVP